MSPAPFCRRCVSSVQDTSSICRRSTVSEACSDGGSTGLPSSRSRALPKPWPPKSHRWASVATAVEPGLFRTNFLDVKSVVMSANAIPDYTDTVGAMRSRTGQLDGAQPGDPSKLAHAILTLANAAHPPVHLPLGTDSVAQYRRKIAAPSTKEILDWQASNRQYGL